MPVWRDDWRTDGSVVVIAPDDIDAGAVRQATVLLFTERTEPEVEVSDSVGRRYLLALPPSVLNQGHFVAETGCTLHLFPL